MLIGNEIEPVVTEEKENEIIYNNHIGEIPDMEFVSYPYKKYGEVVLAVQLEQGNLQLCELSRYLSNGTYKGYLETLDFVTALGERMAVCMNYCRGKNTKEMKEEIDGRKSREQEQKNERVHQVADAGEGQGKSGHDKLKE